MAFKKLLARHKEVLYEQVAAFNNSPTTLSPWFADQENADRYGFEPIKIGVSRICQVIQRLDIEKIEEKRAEFLAHFNDTPLSFKKIRVMELSKLYDGAKSISAKQSILRDIHNEMGENLEKMRDITNILVLNTQERFDERLQRALDIGSHVIGQPT